MYARIIYMSDSEVESDDDNLCVKKDTTGGNCCIQKSLILENIDTFDSYKNMDLDEGRSFEFRMMNACTMGQLEVVDKYLESHNVDDFLYSGWTPLLYAASGAQAEVIEHLIKSYSANVNKHKDGYTPLMALSNCNKGTKEERIKCLAVLIEAGANANASNKQRQTALMYACASQESEYVSELLKYVKNINATDNRRQTALMYATIANKPHIVKILIENAADITITDYNDLTVSDIASMKGYNSILSLINCDGEEEDMNTVNEITERCSWEDMFPSLCEINKQTIDYDIFTILHGMGLDTYGHVFQGMDLKTFLKLTDHDLRRLGVDINIHRMQFMEHLHQFHRKKWNVRSIGAINKSSPYTIYDGIITLGTVARQIAVIGSSFRYIKNCLVKATNENMSLNDEQIAAYERELKRTQESLNVLQKELIKAEALSKVIQKENDIGKPATYIGPKQRKRNWTMLLSVTLIVGIYVSKTVCIPKLIRY